MTHTMTITLSDDEYAALADEAARTGKDVNLLLREAVAKQFVAHTRAHTELSAHDLFEQLYQAGAIDGIPTGERDTPEESAERERLAQLFGQGSSISDMVIEDRGPF